MLLFNNKIVETHLPLFIKALMGAKEWKYYYGKAHPEQGHSQIRSQQTSTAQTPLSKWSVTTKYLSTSFIEGNWYFVATEMHLLFKKPQQTKQQHRQRLTLTWPQLVAWGQCVAVLAWVQHGHPQLHPVWWKSTVPWGQLAAPQC